MRGAKCEVVMCPGDWVCVFAGKIGWGVSGGEGSVVARCMG